MIIGQLTLTSGVSGYVDFYVKDVKFLDLMVEVITSSALGSVTLYDGFGPIDPTIPVPYVQLVPYTVGANNAHGTSVVTWDLKGIPYALSGLLSNRQTTTIGITRNLGSDWLSVGIPTTGASTQINIHARVS